MGVWIWIHKIMLQFRCRGHYDWSRQSHQACVQWLINYKGTRCSVSFHMQSHWIALQEREGSYSLLVALISLVARAVEMFWCPQQRAIGFWKGIAQQCSEHHWRPRWHSLQLSVPWHPWSVLCKVVAWRTRTLRITEQASNSQLATSVLIMFALKNTLNEAEVERQETQQFGLLRRFLRVNKVSSNLGQRITRFLQYTYHQREANSHDPYILDYLSKSLKAETSYKMM